jgi:hypothetical protein
MRKPCDRASNLRYRRSKRGKIKTTYAHMKKRVRGKCKSANLYKGLKLLNQLKFFAWSYDDPDFNRIFDIWVASNYEDSIKPSIDRIDTTKGYVLGNMRWVELVVNISNHK